MKVFKQREMKEALAYAATGEIAVHLHYFVFPKSPLVFRRAVDAGYPIAHMFGKETDTLEAIAMDCGVKVIKVEHVGTARQHIDLCGVPLRHCLEQMGEDIEQYRIEKCVLKK